MNLTSPTSHTLSSNGPALNYTFVRRNKRWDKRLDNDVKFFSDKSNRSCACCKCPKHQIIEQKNGGDFVVQGNGTVLQFQYAWWWWWWWWAAAAAARFSFVDATCFLRVRTKITDKHSDARSSALLILHHPHLHRPQAETSTHRLPTGMKRDRSEKDKNAPFCYTLSIFLITTIKLR